VLLCLKTQIQPPSEISRFFKKLVKGQIPKKQIVSPNFNHGRFTVLSTDDDLATQALVWLRMVWFKVIWFCAL
jgi:hypothetical protein